MRVVLDTNVIVAGTAYPNGPPGRIVAAWRRGAIQVVLSPWILTECARVLPRLNSSSGLSAAEIREWVDHLAFTAELVTPQPPALLAAAGADLRDIADEPVLATLLAAAADWLVTGDKDLRALASRDPIVSPADFCERYVP